MLTVSGQTIAENLADLPGLPTGQDIIFTADAPYAPAGKHIRILHGNLAAEGCVLKQSGKNLATSSGPARVFEREEKVVWRCRNCGYLHIGHKAPIKCAACDHDKAHFELLGENW